MKKKIILIVLIVFVLFISIYKFTVEKNKPVTNNRERTLLYTIYSERVDCLTPRLSIYSDDSYEYKDAAGGYSYDLESIFADLVDYETSEHGAYVLIDKDNKKYVIDENNQSFNEFLTSIGIDLDICDEFGEEN